MKNKKIVVCLLIAVMVLGFTLTALVGCKEYKDVKFDDWMDFVSQAVENTAADKNLNNMNLATSIAVDTKYGDAQHTYTVDLAASLALDTEKTNTNAASLVIKDGDKNVVSAYYDEATTKQYVFLHLGDGNDAKKFRVNGVLVKETLKKNNKSVSDDEADAINEAVVDGIDGLKGTLGILAGLDGVKMQKSKNGLAYRLEIQASKLLEGFTKDETSADAIDGIIDMVGTQAGIDLTIENLTSILDGIVIGLNINVDGKKAETAKITGVSADLTCPSKDAKINRKVGGTLLQLKLDKDFSANVKMDFFFEENKVQRVDNPNNYTALGGAINLSASGTLTLDNDVKGAIKVNGSDMFHLDIEKGAYTLNLAIAADPAALVECNFTGIHSTKHAIDTAIDALNKAVERLKIEIKKADGSDFLKIDLVKQNGALTLTEVNVAALGMSSSVNSLLSSGFTISGVFNLLDTLGVKITDTLDAGYVYTNGKDYKDGYSIAPGYVDADKNGAPDKDGDGNYVLESADYELHHGLPTYKANCGYVKDGDTWKVDTEHGYKATDKGTVEKDKDGNFVCADGYVLHNDKPMLKADYDALPDSEKPKTETEDEVKLTLTDVMNKLSILIGVDGNILKATLGELKLNKDLTIGSAGVTVNSTGVDVDATINGLNKLLAALPESLGIKVNIKLSDFQYGNAKN